ncbi:WD40 repeat domain-containing protein [Kitasatospora sp. NPDC007106]|uniref:WD40 repeat domain-containing protein n=1 Tax=Kitasatospora sp. NPDC007106 TaxID=3156914 RepID=UPI0033E67441
MRASVIREIRCWLKRDPAGENLILVLTAGKLTWNEEACDFDGLVENEETGELEESALPAELYGVFRHEPLYLPLDRVNDSNQLTLLNPRFSAPLAQIAARIHGRPVDELAGEDVTQHKRRTRMIRVAVSGLAALALVASGAAVVAIRQRQIAVERLAIANSRQLATAAGLRSQSDLQTAMLLSAAAFQISKTAEARANLMQQLQRSQHVERFVTGPGKAISSLALSPDGRTLVSVSTDSSQLLLWDLEHPKAPARTLRGGRHAYSAVFSPDGKTLAVKEVDRVVLWDPTSGTSKATFNGTGPPAFSPDGHILAIPGIDKTARSYPSGKITLWDVDTRTEVDTLLGDAGEATGLFSPDGRILAMNQGADVLLWDVSTGTLLGTLTGGHTRGVLDMAFSPDGRMIATGGHDAKLILWDVATRATLATWERDGDVNAVAFSPDGRILAAGDNSAGISLWDVANRTRLDILGGGHTSAVLDIAFSPDGRKLISSGNDGRLIMWNIIPQNPMIVTTVPGTGKDYSGSPAFSPDGNILAFPTDGGVLLWDIPRQARLARLPGSGDHPAFSPDGRTLATIAGTDILLWDVARRSKTATLAGATPTDPASTGVVFSPDGSTLAAAANRAVVLWDVARRERVATLIPQEGDDYQVHGLAFSPNGRLLAAGGYGFNRIIIWDVAKKAQRSAFSSGSGETVYRLSFSPKGDVLAWKALESANTAVGGDFGIILWDIKAKARRTTYTLHAALGEAVAFSPDGSMLASDGGGVSLWSIAQGEQMAILTVPWNPDPTYLRGPVFSPDGRFLATTGSDNSIVLWDVDAKSWVHRLCMKAGRAITPSEWDSILSGQPYHSVCGQ